jgi:5-formyltetrahydrofolate cyclo-ligase
MEPRERGLELSAAVVGAIAASAEFKAANTVLTYLAFGSEVDLTSLTDWTPPANERSARFAVPLTHSPDALLTFHLLDGAEFLTSRSGFREPLAAAPQVSLADVDLVLVPGLAFDVSGARLGYGKGFYDRFLAQLATVDPGVPTVGVTLDELVLDALPMDSHDMKVSHLATQSGVRRVQP